MSTDDGYAGDITPEEAWQRLEDNPKAVLVDCRTRAEWSFVGVPELGALGKRTVFAEWTTFPDGTPNADFVDELRSAGIADDDEVIFLCRSGQRSIAAAQAATRAGMAQSYNVLDGFEGGVDEQGHRGRVGWRALNLPWRQA